MRRKGSEILENVCTSIGENLYPLKLSVELVLCLFVCSCGISRILQFCVKFGDDVFSNGCQLLLKFRTGAVEIEDLAAVCSDYLLVFLNLPL